MMISCKRRLVSATVAGVLGLTGAAFAQESQPTQQELLDTVKQLQAKVADLEAKQQTADTRIDKAIVDKTIADIQQDSERRGQLLAPSGFTAGYDKGKFLIQSEDGNYVLHPYVQFMFRHATTYREDARDGGTADDTQNGFEVRRLKFGLDGNFISKDLTYHFLWATNRKSGNLVLEEAYGIYKFADDFSIQAGQYKNYFIHEAMSSSKRLFAAERSLINNVFTGGDDFVQGAALLYKHDNLRGAISYTDGSNAPNQNFQDFPTNKANFGFAGRMEYKVMGDWKSYEDFTALDNKSDMLVLGAGADYTEAGDTGTLGHTIDAQFETNRLALYAAYLGRTISEGAGSDRYDYGGVLQGGYLLNGNWEPFARYSYLHLDADSVGAGLENDVHEITLGLNYYISGHNAKFTADVTWLPNGSPVTEDGAAILATPNGSNELVLRVQFQLLI